MPLLLVFAGAATAAWFAALLREKDIRPVRALAAFLGGQPKAGRALLAALLAALWIAAGAKPGGVLRRTPAVRAAAARMLSEEDFRRGFVMTRTGTGEAFGFDAPTGRRSARTGSAAFRRT